MRDSNSRGVAPNTLSNNAERRSRPAAAVRDLRGHDPGDRGERSRTGVNETKSEITVVEIQATGSCLRAELNRWPMFSVIRQANRAHPSQTFAGDWLSA